MKKQCRVKVPASSANLGPGFDTIGIALDIYNEFEAVAGDEDKLTIELEGEGSHQLPTNQDNLVYRAIRAGFELADERMPNLHIRQKNVIPLNRGMGSSASAILGGLMIAQEMLENRLSEETLVKKAIEMEGHPDNVTAAYHGGIVLNYLEKGDYHTLRFMPPVPISVVLVIPDILVSTAEARSILPEKYPREDVVTTIQNTALLMYSLLRGEYSLLKAAMRDVVHQIYRGGLIPGCFEAFEAAYEAGALGAAISGSGSTLIALCTSGEREIAEAMCRIFNGHFIPCSSRITEISEKGACFIK